MSTVRLASGTRGEGSRRNTGVCRAPRLQRLAPLENQAGDLFSGVAADPNDPDAAPARWRRNGDDGVFGGEHRSSL